MGLRPTGALSVLFLLMTSVCFGNTDRLLNRYKALMEQYPARTPQTHRSCKTPAVAKNRQAARYATALKERFKTEPPTVNFCGRYFAFNTPITGGGDLFLSDCRTGKITTIHGDVASHRPLITAKSCLLIEMAPGPEEHFESYQPSAYGPPRVYQWTGRQLVSIKDPVLPKNFADIEHE